MNLSSKVDRKFVDSIDINDLEIETDTGWQNITAVHKTIPYKKWFLRTESNKTLYCADTHILFDENYNEIFAKSLISGKSKIITSDGIEVIEEIECLDKEENMYDITVDSNDHRYFTNNILSHNSSCTIDSIVFALYGKPFRKTNKPNIINSINKSGLLVELEFSIGNREYKIIRGIKPNIFEIYQNGVLLNQDAKSKDYQEYLEKYILKTNYKSFINVVILGSARYIPFMSMSSSDRRAIIEELLDIQIFSTMNILLKEKVSKLKEEIATYSYNIELSDEKIELQRQNILEHKKNSKDQITQKQKEIKKSAKQIETLKSNITLIEKHIKVLESKIKDKPSIDSKKNKLISIESKIETNLKILTKDCEFYEKNDSCPTCKQSIEPSHKTKQIQKNTNKINDLNEGLKKLNVEVVDIEDKISKINDIQIKIQEHQSEIVRINASIIAIQNYIQKELTQINKISETFENLEDNNDRLKELLIEAENYENKKKEATEIKKYYDFSSLLLKDGGIKTRIIKQ